MAQKREKEETELKVPETISLCTPTITVSNTDDKTHASLSSITSDLKFSGFNESRSTSARSPESSDLVTPPEKNSGDNDRRSVKTSIDANRRSKSPESSDLVSNDLRSLKMAMEENRCSGIEFRRGRLTESLDLASDSPPPERKAGENDRRSVKRPRESTPANRCSGIACRRKVGLMGFRCRCGEVFCSEHRYSDRHECSYDYKAAGREAIARENPVVRAAKIVKV